VPERDDPSLTPAGEIFARIVADAIVEDLLSGHAAGLWIAVACTGEADQVELARRLREEGREVIVRSRTA
jgi:hypothetical protein